MNGTKVWTVINNVCRKYRKVFYSDSKEAMDILNEAKQQIFDIIDGLLLDCDKCVGNKPSEFGDIAIDCTTCGAVQYYIKRNIAKLKEGK